MRLASEFAMRSLCRRKWERDDGAEISVDLDFANTGRAAPCRSASSPASEWEALVREPEQRLMMALEHRKGRALFAQTQDEAPGMLNHPCGDADDPLHHGTDAASLGGVTHRAVRTLGQCNFLSVNPRRAIWLGKGDHTCKLR